MSERIQEYLDQQPPLTRIGGGMQSTVYKRGNIVVKIPHPKIHPKLRAEAALSLRFTKEHLGGLVVPFQVAESLNLRIARTLWWHLKTTQEDVMIQQYAPRERHLVTALTNARGNERQLGELMERMFSLADAVLSRGMLTFDLHVDNFALTREDELALLDTGSVTRHPAQLHYLAVDGSKETIARNIRSFARFLPGGATRGILHPLGQKLTKRFEAFFSLDNLGRMLIEEPKPQPGQPVPDVTLE